MMTSQQRFLAAINKEPLDRPPVWIMRQAGRYLPEYRALKEQYSFLEMVRTPELALEVTLQPLRRFELDAAILFSDILVIPEALGQPYHFRDQGGIGMDYILDSDSKIEALDPGAIREKLAYVPAALRLLRTELDSRKALLGFCGSPWTLAAYMVEGGSSDNFLRLKELIHEHPASFHKLMDKLVHALREYVIMQKEAGADAIQIFDSWGALCPGHRYQDWSLQWIRHIIEALPKGFPVIVYAKGMAHHAHALASTGCQVLSLDWTVKLDQVHESLNGDLCLQGNLDPTLLNTRPELVRQATLELLDSMRNRPGHIFNLGHGILPQAKIENVATLVETVIEYSS